MLSSVFALWLLLNTTTKTHSAFQHRRSESFTNGWPDNTRLPYMAVPTHGKVSSYGSSQFDGAALSATVSCMFVELSMSSRARLRCTPSDPLPMARCCATNHIAANVQNVGTL